jgi:NAD(P)-dependent dehydrogenase (short-subunit alcohol dehydrogenase family)
VAASRQKKIVTLTSVIGSIGGNTIGGLYAYRSTKAAANAVMRSMGIDLAKRNIVALPVHPGWARTAMGGPRADLDPADAVRSVREVIAGLTLDQAGRFLSYAGQELPW